MSLPRYGRDSLPDDLRWQAHPSDRRMAVAVLDHPAVVDGPAGRQRLAAGDAVAVGSDGQLWPVSAARLKAMAEASAAGLRDVLDYSSGSPPSPVISAGWGGVVRYAGSPGAGKNMTSGEYARHEATGVPVALVHEEGAGWMLDGVSAGQRCGQVTLADATRCGMTDVRVVYAACDIDVTSQTQLASVDACLDGLAGVVGRGRVGVYGEADVIDHCLSNGKATWGWQTRAWSGGRVSRWACLLQQIGYVYVAGVECDRNTVLRPDWGQSGGDMPITDADIMKLASSPVFRDAVRQQVIAALADPTHAYLQDELAPFKQAVTDGRAKLDAIIGGKVDLGAFADKLAQLLRPHLTSGVAKAKDDEREGT